MSYSYPAQITFSSMAKSIPEIKDYVEEIHIGLNCIEDEGEISILDENSSNGNMRIAAILQKHKVPYDHYHRDDNACETWTDKYRLKEGELVMTRVSSTDEMVARFADQAISLLKLGNMTDLHKLLQEASEKDVGLLPNVK